MSNYLGSEKLSIILFLMGTILYAFIAYQTINTFEIVFTGTAIILLIFISFMFFRKQLNLLMSNFELFIPLGYLTFFNSLARLFLDLGIISKVASFSVLNARLFAEPLSNNEFFSLMYIFASSVVYTTWTMQIILQVSNDKIVNTTTELKLVLKNWWKVAILMIVGYGVLIIFTPIVFVITEGFYSSSILLTTLCIIWNIITAFSLLIVLNFESHFFRNLKNSFSFAWKKKLKLLFPITLHTFLLGTVTMFPIISGTPKASLWNNIGNNGWVWSINGVWNGALSNSFNWYSTFLRGSELQGNLLLFLIVSLSFSIFAIIIKLKIAEICFEDKNNLIFSKQGRDLK